MNEIILIAELFKFKRFNNKFRLVWKRLEAIKKSPLNLMHSITKMVSSSRKIPLISIERKAIQEQWIVKDPH